MEAGEVFDAARLQRCCDIHFQIMRAAVDTGEFEYTARATEPVVGLPIRELLTKRFAVGLGEDVVEIPFLDMLVVFDQIKQHGRAMDAHVFDGADQITFRLEFKTFFTAEEIRETLRGIWIALPFDGDGTGFLNLG